MVTPATPAMPAPPAAFFDPDLAPRRAVVLCERHGPGQGLWHTHRRTQLIHASEGVIHVHTGRGHWVVPPQRAVWIPPDTPHSVGSSAGYLLQTLYADARVRALPDRAAVVPVTPLLEQLLQAAARFGGDYAPRGAPARLVQVLLDELPRALGQLELPQLHLPEPVDPRLRRITAAWHADPADPRGLAVLSAQAGLSERSAARGFLQETGLTPGDWRTQRRMLAAIERLSQGRAVTPVAFEVGYADVSSFIAVFRRTFGTTPAAWAAAMLQR